MSDAKKKEAPESIVRAVDVGSPVKRLQPVRRVAIPLAIAAALVLGGGAGTAAALGGAGAKGARVDAQGQAMDPLAINAPVPTQAPVIVTPPTPSAMPTTPPIARPPFVPPTHEVPMMAGVMPPPRHRPPVPSKPGTTI